MKIVSNLVDVFIIGEVEVDYGHRRNDSLVASLARGYLTEYHQKLVYVNISDTSGASTMEKLHATTDGGLRLMSDLRPDDMLLFTTAEQILARNFLIFLKIFHNYPQPVKCDIERYLYGFFWKTKSQLTDKTNINNVAVNSFSNYNNYNTDTLNRDRYLKKREIRGEREETNYGDATVVFNNIAFADRFGEKLLLPPESSEGMPQVCSVSVHVFSTVFEHKVALLHYADTLVRKPQYAVFFGSLEQPLFIWTFAKAGWLCHLCNKDIDSVYLKLMSSAKNSTKHLKWLRSDNSYKIVIAQLIELRKKGLNEYLKDEVETNPFSLKNEASLRTLPKYVLNNSDYYRYLLVQ